MNYYLLIYLIIICLSGCSFLKKSDKSHKIRSTSSINENSEKIQKQINWLTEEYSDHVIEWWLIYKTALDNDNKNSKSFCDSMNFLSQVNRFPLKNYARLHYYSHCQDGLSLDLSEFPKYLKKKASLAWLKKAQQNKHPIEIMKASYYLHQLSTDKNRKERYLTTALRLAKKHNDPQAQEWRQKFYKLFPRYIKNPSLSQMLKVANDFRRVRRFKSATFYYRKLLNTNGVSFKNKDQAFKWMVWIYKDQQKTKKYLKAATQWRNWLKKEIKKSSKVVLSYHNVSTYLARIQWTLGDPQLALKTLSQLEKELKNRISFFEIYRLKGFLFEELGDLKKSLSFFKKSVKEKPFDQDAKEKVWRKYAWTLYKSGKTKKAIAVLKDLLAETKNDYLRSRILFWLGRWYAQTNQQKEAQKIYKTLIKTDPLSYFGLLAHYETNTPISIHKKVKKANWKQYDPNEDYKIARWLISLEKYEDVRDFLNTKHHKYQKDLNKETKNWMGLFYYMAIAKFYLPFFQMVGNLPLMDRTFFFKSHADLLFPMMYQKEIEDASRLFNIEKELIYALIRQESAYNPKARSPSDAFGLMQIKPNTAKRMTQETGVPYKGTRSLYHPKTNIMLGTAFLKKQFKKWNFQFIVTLAVYNAGGRAVRRWLKQKNNTIKDPIMFIEEIPFEETRIYVMLLIRNFIFYKLLNHPERTIQFPNWILHIAENYT